MATKLKIRNKIDSRIKALFEDSANFGYILIGDPNNKENKEINDKDEEALTRFNAILELKEYKTKQYIRDQIAKLKKDNLIKFPEKKDFYDDEEELTDRMFAILERNRIVKLLETKHPLLANKLNDNINLRNKVLKTLESKNTSDEVDILLNNILNAEENQLINELSKIGIIDSDGINEIMREITQAKKSDENELSESEDETESSEHKYVNLNVVSDSQSSDSDSVSEDKPGTDLTVVKDININIKDEFQANGAFSNVIVNDAEDINDIFNKPYQNKDDIKRQINELKTNDKIKFANETDADELTNRIFAELEQARIVKSLRDRKYTALSSVMNIHAEPQVVDALKNMNTSLEVDALVKKITDAKENNELNDALSDIGIKPENVPSNINLMQEMTSMRETAKKRGEDIEESLSMQIPELKPNITPVMSNESSALITDYLRILKETDIRELVEQKKMGSRLYEVLRKSNIQSLTETELVDALLKTTRPLLFAENIDHAQGDGSDWTQHEIMLLGRIARVVKDVTVYSKRTLNPSEEDIFNEDEQPNATLLFVNGALLVGCEADLKRVVSYDRIEGIDIPKVNEVKFEKFLEDNLLPSILFANQDAGDQGAVVTLPVIGGGEFAGGKNSKLAKQINDCYVNVVTNLIKKNKEHLPNIKAVVITGIPQRGQHTEKNCPTIYTTPDSIGLAPVIKNHTEDLIGLKVYAAIAGDHLSFPGNDGYAGSPKTHEGGCSTRTNVYSKITDEPGEFNPENQIYSPDDGNWLDVCEDNKTTLNFSEMYVFEKNVGISIPFEKNNDYQPGYLLPKKPANYLKNKSLNSESEEELSVSEEESEEELSAENKEKITRGEPKYTDALESIDAKREKFINALRINPNDVKIKLSDLEEDAIIEKLNAIELANDKESVKNALNDLGVKDEKTINAVLAESIYIGISDPDILSNNGVELELIESKKNSIQNYLSKLSDVPAFLNALSDAKGDDLKLFIQMFPDDIRKPGSSAQAAMETIEKIQSQSIKDLFQTGQLSEVFVDHLLTLESQASVKKKEPVPVIEEALGDGNCAFNAFILGFSQDAVLDHLQKIYIDADNPDPQNYEKFMGFVSAASEKLETSTDFVPLSEKIRELRDGTYEQRKELQEKLAEVMRPLSTELAILEPDKYGNDAFINDLLEAAFREHYLEKIEGIEFPDNEKDDIFRRHSYIEEKFEEFAGHVSINTDFNSADYLRLKNIKPNDRNDDEKILFNNYEKMIDHAMGSVKDNLLHWWQETGHNEFLVQMNTSGKYAGDKELWPLASLFHVNLEIDRKGLDKNKKFPIYRANGILKDIDDLLTNDRKAQLEARGIIEKRDDELHLLAQPNDEQVKSLLEGVPNDIFEAVQTQIASTLDLEGPVIGSTVLNSSPPVNEQLIKLGIIAKSPNSDDYIYKVGTDDALARIEPIFESDEEITTFLQAWTRDYKPSPSIIVEHVNSNHYNYLKSESLQKSKPIIINVDESEESLSESHDDDSSEEEIIIPVAAIPTKFQTILENPNIDPVLSGFLGTLNADEKKNLFDELNGLKTDILKEPNNATRRNIADRLSSARDKIIGVALPEGWGDDNEDSRRDYIAAKIFAEYQYNHIHDIAGTKLKTELEPQKTNLKAKLSRLLNHGSVDAFFMENLNNESEHLTLTNLKNNFRSAELTEDLAKHYFAEQQFKRLIKDFDGEDEKLRLLNDNKDRIIEAFYNKPIETNAEARVILHDRDALLEAGVPEDRITELLRVFTPEPIPRPIVVAEPVPKLTDSLNALKKFMEDNSYEGMHDTNTKKQEFINLLNNVLGSNDLSKKAEDNTGADHALRINITNVIAKIEEPSDGKNSYKALKEEIKTLDKFATQFTREESKRTTIANLHAVTTVILDETRRLIGSEISRKDPENEAKIKENKKDCIAQRDKLEIVKAKINKASDSPEVKNIESQINALNDAIKDIDKGQSYEMVRTYARKEAKAIEFTGATKELKMQEILNSLKPKTTAIDPGRDPVVDIDSVGTGAISTGEREEPALPELKPVVMEAKHEANKYKLGPSEIYYVTDETKIQEYKDYCRDKGIEIEYDKGIPIIKLRIATARLDGTHMGITRYDDVLQFLDAKEKQVMAVRFVERTYNSRSADDKDKVMILSNATDKDFAEAIITYCKLSKAEHKQPRYRGKEPGKYPIDKDYEKQMKKNLSDPDVLKRTTGTILLKSQKPEITKEKLEPKEGWFSRFRPN